MIVRIARVKVGNRQASQHKTPSLNRWGFCFFYRGIYRSSLRRPQPQLRRHVRRHRVKGEGCAEGSS